MFFSLVADSMMTAAGVTIEIVMFHAPMQSPES